MCHCLPAAVEPFLHWQCRLGAAGKQCHTGILLAAMLALSWGAAGATRGETASAAAVWTATPADPPAVVAAGPASEPMAFAAAELRRYLEAILGVALPREAGADGSRPVIRLAIRPDAKWSDEAFELAADGRTFSITAGGPTGLVYGVYEFLRRFGGCQFSDLGPDGEHVPRRTRIEAPSSPLRMTPRLWYRALQFSLLEDAELSRQRIDWMAKNGLNYVVYSPASDDMQSPSGEHVGTAEQQRHMRDAAAWAHLVPRSYSKAWFDRELRPDIRRRGLKLDMNHHNLLYWLPPRRYLAAHPDWYALSGGKRGGSMSQLCICDSNPDAVAAVIGNVRAYLRANSEVKIVGVIPEDGFGACQCDKCVANDKDPKDVFRPGGIQENRAKSNRYARLLNAVARAIRGEFPDVLVGGAAYVDLVYPPRDVVYEPNTLIWVAMYWRDGCRPLAAANTSQVNLGFFDILRQWKKVYSGRLTVYEYYMGMAAQCSLPYPMSEVICRDWPNLAKLGVQGATVQCRTTCQRSYLLNHLAFARCGWHERVDHGQVLADYLMGAYGSVADQVRPIFQTQLEVTRQWARGEEQLRPDADNVRRFVSPAARIVFRDALASAAQKAGNDRERRQVQRLAAAVRYWQLSADFFELVAQASPLAKSDPKTASTLLHRALDESWPRIEQYLEGSVPPGWLDCYTPYQWRHKLKPLREQADALQKQVDSTRNSLSPPPRPKELVREITASKAEYSIALGGTLDSFNTAQYKPLPGANMIELPGFQPNLTLAIENVGQQNVVNPRIVINDRHDWFSLDTLVAEVARPGMTDREKAFAVFEVFRDNFYHTNAPMIWPERGLLSSHSYDPIKHLNWHENTGCSCMAITMASVWERAGLKSRVVNFGVDHWIGEVFYDQAWHMFDADMKVFNLRRDNKTVASIDDCRADPGLIQRSHHFGFAAPDNPGGGPFRANSASPYAAPKDHTMALALRPGESLIRGWPDPEAKPLAGDERYGPWAPKHGRGKLVYKPDLSKPNALDGASWHYNVASFGADGKRPYLHTKQAPYYCELVFPVRSPYPIVGGRIQVAFDNRDGGGFYPEVLVSFEGRNWLSLWRGPSNKPAKCDVPIDSFIDINRRAPQCEYFVKIQWLPWHGQALMGIDSLAIESDLAMSIRSLPTLRLGENKVVYRDDTAGARSIRVTHRWRESAANTPPSAPASPVSPTDLARAESSGPLLQWEPADDADGDRIVDHHVEVRARPDMRFPLATNLDRLTFSNKPQWKVPDGWLIPGERYYWHVRAKDSRGAWGPWSRTWSFVAAGGPSRAISSAQKSPPVATTSVNRTFGIQGVDHD